MESLVASETQLSMRDPRDPVPFIDLKAQYATLKDDVRKAVDEVMESQQFVLGETVAQFEQAVAEECDSCLLYTSPSPRD